MVEVLVLLAVAGLTVYLWDRGRRERALGWLGVIAAGWARRRRARRITMAGDEFFRKEQYEEALGHYAQAIELDPRFAAAYNHRGLVYWSLDDVERAIADYSRAIKLKPRHGPFYYSRALAHRALGNREAAIADFEKVLELTPSFSSLRGWGQGYTAIADFEKVLEWSGDARLIAEAREQIAELRG